MTDFQTNTKSIPLMPAQVAARRRREGACFTLMVAGESALGKSTFVRTMFGSEYLCTKSSADHKLTTTKCVMGAHRAREADARSIAGAGPLAARVSQLDVHPTSRIEVYRADVIENDFVTRLTVIDTPGFGDYTNNDHTWVPLVNYIDEQHQYYMLQEEQPDRRKLTDTRVHVCLYFLAPTARVLELDITAMQELGSRVNLVPVIAKADSMTREDLLDFKKQVRTVLKDNDIQCWAPDAGADKWPFGVVASDSLVLNERGEKLKGRQYRWGTVEIENPEFCDFGALRDALFGQGMLSLIDTTASVHYARLRKSMRVLRLQHALRAVERSSAPGTPGSATRSTASRGRLAPEERASLGFLRSGSSNSVRAPVSPFKVELEAKVAEEAARSMSGLETHVIISRLGADFLNGERDAKDELYHQRERCLRAQFDVVARFQQERFDEQATQLEGIRDELNLEVAQMNDANSALAQEILEMEAALKKHK